jgi:maleate isomerase
MNTRNGPKIGVLVPYTNTNLEPDMLAICPAIATVHFARLGGYDVNEIPGADQMAGLGASDMTEALRLIAGVRPAAILYGCTSATLSHGPEFDRDLAETIGKSSNAHSLTAASSIVAALRELGAHRVGFASPYIGEVNDLAAEFLASEGIEAATIADIGRDLGNYGQGELDPDEVFDLAMRADADDLDALLLSCTDMRSVEVIGRLEAAIGKPVVTSNQAMMFCAMKALGLAVDSRQPGRLFDLL